MKQGDKSSTLREVERCMSGAILQGNATGGSSGVASELAAWVTTPDAVSIEERLAIHINGYPARVYEALLESFPAVHRVVGERALKSLVYRFLPHLPENNYNLNRVGQALPDFLRADALAESLPFLPDLARLEWCLVEAFHAPLLAPADLRPCADWGLEQWSQAKLAFQPSVAITCSDWPIGQIWKARTVPAGEIDLELAGRPERVLVYRRGPEVECECIDETEAEALKQLLAGETLGVVLETLADQLGERIPVRGWFSRWTALSLLTGVASGN